MKYSDLLSLPNHRSKTRPHMSRQDRAAQFSPFAALSGHAAAIKETARLTERKIILTEEAQAQLNAKLALIRNELPNKPELTITYFLPDQHKSGGAYLTETGIVKAINAYEKVLIMENGVSISITEISSISGDLFDLTKLQEDMHP